MKTALTVPARILFVAAVALVFLTKPAAAQTINWTNTLGGLWEDAGNWSPNGAPGPTTGVTFTVDGNYTVYITNSTADANPTTMEVNTFSMGNGVGDTQHLVINYTNTAVTLRSTTTGITGMYIGSLNGASPTVDLIDGTVEINGNVRIGNSTGSDASLNLLGGDFTSKSATFYIGAAASGGGGTGRVLVAGGNLWLTNITSGFVGPYGQGLGGYGVMTVSNGSVNASGGTLFVVGRGAGGGRGELYVRGGTVTLDTGVSIASQGGSTGYVLQTGGNIHATNMTGSGTSFFAIGGSDAGTMVISNTGVLSANRLALGYSAGGIGDLTITEGGRLNMTGVNYLRAGVNAAGAGSVSNVDGGTIQFTINNPDVAVGSGTGNGVVRNAAIEYKNVAAADLNGNPYSFFSFSGTNTLRMINSSNAPVSSYSLQTNGSANFATLDLVDNSYFHSTNLFVGAGARILGTGTVDGNVTTNQGTLSPGHSAGTLAFTGDLTLGSTSVLDLEIGGASSNQYDHLIVAGTLTRDGSFNLTFIDGYTPVGGDTFSLINAGALAGAFTSTNLPGFDTDRLYWDVSQFDTAGILSIVEIVPEPSTIMLGLTGLGVFFWRRGRRG